jgi:antibiotic biosynthesis monooxygenase (ABM) superfamily enzyme
MPGRGQRPLRLHEPGAGLIRGRGYRHTAALPRQYPGITRVWTKPIKKQLPEGYSNVIVMEFASEDALKKYADSSAQKQWYEVYMPIREESRTSDITN